MTWKGWGRPGLADLSRKCSDDRYFDAETLGRLATPDFLSQRSPALLVGPDKWLESGNNGALIAAHLNQTRQEPVKRRAGLGDGRWLSSP